MFFLSYRALGTRRGTRAYPAQGAEPVIPAATKARGKATLFGEGKNFPGGMLVVKMLLGGRLSFLPSLHLSRVRQVSHCWKGRCGTGSRPTFFLFFHHGKFPGSLSRNGAINTGCMRKELNM